MKVAQIVCAYPPYAGGIGNSAYQITQLVSGQHEITTFAPQTMKPWLRYGHGAFLPQLLWRLNGFDTIILHYPFFGTAEVVWLFKIFHPKKKLIIQYHMDVKNLGFLTKLLSWPSRLIRWSLLNQAETIVCASLDYVSASQIKKYYKKHPEKFREVPFAVNTDKFQPRVIRQPNDNQIIAKAKEIVHFINERFLTKKRLELLFVGALDRAHYFKGLDNLLAAVLILPDHGWHLNIVGDGDERQRYEEQAKKLGLSSKVTFTGKLSDDALVRAYQEADLLILPSINTNEAFGLVLIEALSCGTPVIASNLPGVRCVFSDRQEGLLVKPGDVADLAKKLEFIFHNEKLRRMMSVSARHLALAKYDEKILKKEWQGLIEQTHENCLG